MAVDRWRNYTTPSLVIGTAISVLASFLLYLTDVTDFGISLLVGLVGVVLSVEIDLLDRNEFSSVFMNRGWVRYRIREIGELSGQINDREIETLDDELQRKLGQFVADLQETASGRVRRPATDVGLMLRLTEGARTELQAVTNSPDSGLPPAFWLSSTGIKYWERNKAALRRGVRVRRIFVLQPDCVRDLCAGKEAGDLKAFLDEQARAGVEVWLVPADRAPQNARVNFAVWDGRCVWEPYLDAHAQPIYHSFSYDLIDARLAIERFDMLLLEAEAYPPGAAAGD